MDLSRDALYVRQRALVELKLLDVIPGRGPGSGVPLTAKNVAALLISLIAAQDLRFVDSKVVAICRARMPLDAKPAPSKSSFLEDVAMVLVEKHSEVRTIRVTRPWRAQIVDTFDDCHDYYAKGYRAPFDPPRDAWWTGEIPARVFTDLRDATRLLVSVAENEGEED